MKKIIKSLGYLLIMLTLPSFALAQSVPGFTVTEFYSGPRVGGITTDTAGNVYTSSDASGSLMGIISKITPSGEVSIFANLQGSLFGNPRFDPLSGDIFVNNCQSRNPNFPNDSIWRINSSGVVSLFSSGLHCPIGHTRDVSETIFISEHFGKDRISTLSAIGNQTTYLTGLDRPTEIVFGPGGKLYIANSGANQVLQVSPGESVATEFASGFNYPAGMVIDKSGNLYVASIRE